VVVGGEILTFGWLEFGAEGRKLMSEEEVDTLKKMIASSAWTRDNKLVEKIQPT
jgi:hypothetical protein